MPTTRLGTVANAKGETKLEMMTGSSSQKLWQRVPELAGSSAFMLYLADVASDRLSLTQAAFFMLAATADAAGKPATRSTLLQTYPDEFKGSIRNSYRQLLQPSRLYPKALGWLEIEANQMDGRENFLRLTKKGKSVVAGAVLALEPMIAKAVERAN